MRKITHFYDTKSFHDLQVKCNNLEFCRIYKKYDDTLNTKVKKLRFCELLCDIILNNPNCLDYESILLEYKNEKSTIKKVNIRYGQSRSAELSNRLSLNAKKNNSNPNKLNIFRENYYTIKGFTKEEAKRKISEIQSENSLKGHANRKNNDSYRSMNPMCIEYWTNKSNDPITDCYLYKKMYCLSLENFKRRHGHEEGIRLFEEMNHTKRLTTLQTHGVFGFSTQSSKKARKLCLRLFKRFMRLGFCRDQMCAAVGNSKEFVRTDIENKKTYYYDFCLKPLKLIVEYNGIYFHPRDINEWRRKDISFEDALHKDTQKLNFIKALGYDVIVVWEDDDIECKIKEIVDYAKTKMVK